jgi:hypothetical protein
MSDSGDDVKLTVPYLLVLANTSVLSDHGVSWLMSWHARAELPCQTLSLDAFQPVLVCQVSPGDHITKRSLILCNATGSMHRNDSFYSSLTSNHVVQFVTSEEGRLHMYPSHNDDFPEIHCILSGICNVLLGWRSIGGGMSFGRLCEIRDCVRWTGWCVRKQVMTAWRLLGQEVIPASAATQRWR